MLRRTYRLPHPIDQALSQHAKAQGVSASVIVRDALAAYLFVEGAAQRSSLDWSAIRAKQDAAHVLLEQITATLQRGHKNPIEHPTDRVSARFQALTEEHHGTHPPSD